MKPGGTFAAATLGALFAFYIGPNCDSPGTEQIEPMDRTETVTRQKPQKPQKLDLASFSSTATPDYIPVNVRYILPTENERKALAALDINIDDLRTKSSGTEKEFQALLSGEIKTQIADRLEAILSEANPLRTESKLDSLQGLTDQIRDLMTPEDAKKAYDQIEIAAYDIGDRLADRLSGINKADSDRFFESAACQEDLRFTCR